MILVFCIISLIVFLATTHTILRVLETFDGTVYDHPNKCYSCERDIIARLGPEWGWLGQKTKSFDAEKEMIRMTGGDVQSAFQAHPIRYY